MTINYIDMSLNAATFPPTYTGKGTLIGNARKSGGIDNDAWANYTSNGNVTVLLLGFTPREVKVINTTDGLIWEWSYGMPAADSVKLTLGTVAAVMDTSSQITISSDPAGNSTVTLGATLNGTSKNICVELHG